MSIADELKCKSGACAIYINQRADHSGWRIECRTCGISGGERATRERATTAWRWMLAWKAQSEGE